MRHPSLMGDLIVVIVSNWVVEKVVSVNPLTVATDMVSRGDCISTALPEE